MVFVGYLRNGSPGQLHFCRTINTLCGVFGALQVLQLVNDGHLPLHDSSTVDDDAEIPAHAVPQ